jgi:sulfur carrier protein ThiS adenylyltransferase
MNAEQINERYIRQKDIVPAERLATCKATVIGVGAIGRQVALQLTAMGISWLQLVDFDTVDVSNLASQGYLEADLGKLKVEATAVLCKQIQSRMELQVAKHAFRRSMETGNVVFCAVDQIYTRRLIWESVKDRVNFFADGRMTAEVLRIISAYDSESRKHYPTTLFNTEEAYEGPCTAKTTIYCSNIAAGLMIAQFTKYLRQLPIDCDVQLNLLASELNVAEVCQ